ncbi:MAG: hypothetical protein HY854_18425 [Burkholderiales bacterium]|nr:hypothetical protein [Burkholderiales bacterium]
MRKARKQLNTLALRLVELAIAGVFLGAVGHHVYTLNLKPLAALCLPVLVAMFGFTSLLYMRGRSLSRGRDQMRTLFAAERAMQGAIWYFTGIVAAMALHGLVQLLDIAHDPADPGIESLALVLFLGPYAHMQTGFTLFMRAAWLVAPQFMRTVPTREIWRRVHYVPG